MSKTKIPKYLYKIIILTDWDKNKKNTSFNIQAHEENIHLLSKKQLNDIQKNMFGLPNLLIFTINTQKLSSPIRYESGAQCKKNIYPNSDMHYHISDDSLSLSAIEKIDLIENHAFDSPFKYGTSLRHATRQADQSCATAKDEPQSVKYSKEELLLTPLHIAAYKGDIKEIKKILTKKNINRIDKYGWTPLHDATIQGHVEIVKMLIKAGADVDAQDTEEMFTPLHDAARMNFPKIVKLLLDAGANPLIKDKDGEIPAYYAKKYKFKDIIKILNNYKKRG